MSAGPQDFLYETLNRKFDDGSRRAVLILGAGLHHELHSRSESRASSADDWKLFTDWNGLLASIASYFKLPEISHADPTATWESLVTRAAAYRTNKAAQVNDAEREAHGELARRLSHVPADDVVLEFAGRGLIGYRDIISLNIDESACAAARQCGAELEGTPRKKIEDNLFVAHQWSHDDRKGRFWHPHGTTSSPESIVLGLRSYGKVLAALHTAWNKAKVAERSPGNPAPGRWTPETAAAWWNRRRAPEPYEPVCGGAKIRLTWLDLLLGSDLVFVGTRLDRAEIDLWWALHMRQRNLTRVAPSERPRTFIITTEKDYPAHLRTGPAGIVPVVFSAWHEAWQMLLQPPG